MKETLKLALESLEKSIDNFPANVQHKNAITAIKAALAQPAQQEDDADATIIQYHEATIKRLEKRIEDLAQPAQEPWCMKMNGCKTKCDDCPDEPAQEPDHDALSQKQLASLKRDTRISLEDAAVRATHKVMAELGEEAMKDDKLKPRTVLTSAGYIADEDDDIQVYQRPWVGLTEQELESAYWDYMEIATQNGFEKTVKAIEAKLKEKNT
jgi:hypothetical protein